MIRENKPESKMSELLKMNKEDAFAEMSKGIDTENEKPSDVIAEALLGERDIHFAFKFGIVTSTGELVAEIAKEDNDLPEGLKKAINGIKPSSLNYHTHLIIRIGFLKALEKNYTKTFDSLIKWTVEIQKEFENRKQDKGEREGKK